MTRRLLAPILGAALLVSACAYFNALYNARRLFDEAEESARRNETVTADGKYRQALEKAAKSFRRDVDGRWADDALYLVGRAHFERGDHEEARGALRRVVEMTGDDELRAGARAFLGATEVRSGRVERGIALLDSALASLEDEEIRARARLWRGEARFELGERERAFADLERAAAGPTRAAIPAEMKRLHLAVETRDTAEAATAGRHLFDLYDARFWADSIRRTVERAAESWGAVPMYAALEGVEESPWPPRPRQRLLLLRGRLAWEVGDTARALADVRRVASSGVGRLTDEARVLEARWRLSGVESMAELEEIRGILRPAFAVPEARELLDAIKRLGLLVERARSGSRALALFLAAEIARDELEARSLARDFFRVYAEREERSPWRGKALLAALHLADDPGERAEIRERLEAMPENVYVAIANRTPRDGDPDMEYRLVERRLSTVLDGLRAQVDAEAERRDVAATRAAAQLDSLRRRERTDSLARLAEDLPDSVRARCFRLDSLVAGGGDPRADSDALLARCLRGDTLALDTLRVDSLRFVCHRLDSVTVGTEHADSLVARCLRGDTFAADSLRADSLRREGMEFDSLFQRLVPDSAAADTFPDPLGLLR